jgi:hypothetical protein
LHGLPPGILAQLNLRGFKGLNSSLRVPMASIHLSPVTTVLKIIVEMLIIALQYRVMFLLEEHVVFAVASY